MWENIDKRAALFIISNLPDQVPAEVWSSRRITVTYSHPGELIGHQLPGVQSKISLGKSTPRSWASCSATWHMGNHRKWYLPSSKCFLVVFSVGPCLQRCRVCHYFLNQVSFLHLILMMYVFICFPCPTAFSFLCSHIFQQWEVQSQRSTDPESPLTLQNACYCTCKDENQFSGLMTFFVLGLSSGHFRRNVHLPATLDKWVSPSFHWFWVDAGKKSLSWLDLAIHPLVTWQFRWRWRLIYIYLLHPGHPRVCTKTSQIARMLDVFSWAWEMDDMQTCICSQLRLEQCRTIQRDQFLLPFYLWSLGSRRRCSVDFCRGHFLANENNIMQQ